MTNVKTMYDLMLQNKIPTNAFNVEFHRKRFACILTTRDYGATLFLTFIRADSYTIALDLNNDCVPSPFLKNEDYQALADYLELKYDPTNKFTPRVFFDEFDAAISPKICREATNQELTRSIGRANDAKEKDKIYFCGWKQNGTSAHVTDKNYMKTKRLFGDAIAKKLRKANVSSCWTNTPDEENLQQINKYISYI